MLLGYARVSMRDLHSTVQIEALQAAGCARIFVEKPTGAQRDRPELAAALNLARAGDLLVVWKLDRLARSIRQLTNTVDGLRDRGIGLQVLSHQINTSAADGHQFFRILGVVGEFERELMLDRAHAGLVNAKALGRRGGRKPAMGEAEIEQAKRMLADDRITVDEVARQMGVQPSTLYRHIPGGRSALVDHPHQSDRAV